MKLNLEVGHKIAESMRRWDGIRPQDAQDFVQDALLEMVERAGRNGGGLSEAEMWRAARCVRSRYRRAYRKGMGILSLNRPIPGTEIELWETLADNGSDLDALLDAKARLGALPPGILRIARKLEKGDPLTEGQWAYLLHFRRNGKETPNQRWWRKEYPRRRTLSLCVACGKQALASFARCTECLEMARQSQALYKRRKGLAWYARLREHWRKEGRCPRCGRPPQPGRKKCSQCLTKDREHLRHWRETHRGSGARKGEVYARRGGDRDALHHNQATPVARGDGGGRGLRRGDRLHQPRCPGGPTPG